MSEPYTPSIATVRKAYRHRTPGTGYAMTVKNPDPDAEFDRFIAKVRAEALREAANTDEPEFHIEVALGGSDYVRGWLNERADRIGVGQ